jgi:hypothetical protein
MSLRAMCLRASAVPGGSDSSLQGTFDPPLSMFRRTLSVVGLVLWVTLTVGVAVGCTRDNPPSMARANGVGDTPESSASKADAWIGRWNGPEGTYLLVAGADGVYEITIMDLDRARTFKGSAAGELIDFERDGTKETLRPSDGNETGMKWLAGKTNCLTVKPGEGYCRD